MASSVAEHARYGGVVPEVASRAHLEAMLPTVERACADAGVRLGDVDAIAVTSGPGLAGALLVGVAAAKALALGLGRPLYGVNHLAAHVAVDQLAHGPLPEPCLALLVSGGHSSLLLVPDVTHDVRPLGQTIDDAAGEAFDKVARVLGLPFPGGPARRPDGARGRPGAREVPARAQHPARPGAPPLRLLLLRAEDRGGALGRAARARRASRSRSPTSPRRFQEAVVDVLTAKALAACREQGVDTLLLGGGVAANSRLRALAQERCDRAGVALRVPPPRLCTDNGAMVAALGSALVARGRAPSSLDLAADSSMPVTTVTA